MDVFSRGKPKPKSREAIYGKPKNENLGCLWMLFGRYIQIGIVIGVLFSWTNALDAVSFEVIPFAFSFDQEFSVYSSKSSEENGGWPEGTANQRFHKYSILERAKPGTGRMIRRRMGRGPESNRRIEDLQSPALPLGYRAGAPKPLISIDSSPSSKQKALLPNPHYEKNTRTSFPSLLHSVAKRRQAAQRHHRDGRRHGLVGHRLLRKRDRDPNLDRLAKKGCASPSSTTPVDAARPEQVC